MLLMGLEELGLDPGAATTAHLPHSLWRGDRVPGSGREEQRADPKRWRQHFTPQPSLPTQQPRQAESRSHPSFPGAPDAPILLSFLHFSFLMKCAL